MGGFSVNDYILSDIDYIELSQENKDTLISLLDYLYLDYVDFEDFESYFPEVSQDSDKLAHFILNDQNHKDIFKMVNELIRIELNYRKKPTSHLLSDEFDKDDYEDSQNILKAGFRM